MTASEWAEWNCTYLTRIGAMCGQAEPTAEQREQADGEATEHVDQCRKDGVFEDDEY